MNRSPAFQFYPNDFLADAKTMVMSTEEIGAYLLLLCACWKEDGLDISTKKLSRIARLREKKFLVLWENSISACFYLDRETGKYRQKRLDKELKKQKDKSLVGKNAADARWHPDECERNADAMQNDAIHISSSSSSSTAVKNSAKAGDKAAGEITDPVERRIWTDGVQMLTRSGLSDRTARSLLGSKAKEFGKPLLAQCIAITQAENPADPKAFLLGTLKDRSGAIDPDADCSHCENDRRVRVNDFTSPCPKCRPKEEAAYWKSRGKA